MMSWLFGGAVESVANVFEWGLSYLVVIIGGILGSFLLMAAWAIELVLSFNARIMDLPSITIGFNVALAIVNLGFVLGIVAIAIATIIRYEPYGMRQTLWRFVVAAILVNFSRVIVAVILNVADRLTEYFVRAVSSGGISQFALNFSSAFSPQRIITGGGATTAVTDLAGQITAGVIAIFFTLVTIIIFCAFVIMLLARVMAISFLTILMPFAWLSWIFPSTRHLWTKWWSNFMRWTMFAPIMMFFIYLAIFTSQHHGEYTDQIVSSLQGQNTSAMHEINNGIFATFFTNLAGIIANSLIILGLMVGGLMAANSMSITGASAAMNVTKGLRDRTTAWAGRRGKEFATRPLTGAGGRSIIEGLQQGTVGSERGRVLRNLSAPLRTRGGAWIGRGLDAVASAGKEDLVADAKKRLGSLSDDRLANGMSTFTAPERAFALERLRSSGNLDKVRGLEKYLNKDEFERFGQGKAFNDIEKSITATSAARTAASAGNYTALDDANKELARKLGRGDPSKMQLNEVFKDSAKLKPGETVFGMDARALELHQRSYAKQIALVNPSLAASHLSNMKGDQAQRFGMYYVEGLKQRIGQLTQMGAQQNQSEIDDLQKRLDRFDDTLRNYVTGGYDAGTTSTSTASGGAAPSGGNP